MSQDPIKPGMEDLSLLKKNHSDYPTRPEDAELESFSNTHPNRDYVICFDCPEFTAICPITGQPDFGNIQIEYIPAERCIESKSLKLYLGSFRNHGAFHEAVTNQILDALVEACAPKWIKITGNFRPRGGIAIIVTAESGSRG